MPLEQTITIVNNSGKIISTGKQLVSIFKEAKASYQEKKAQIKNERSLQRAQTFAPSRTTNHHTEYYGESDEEDQQYQQNHGRTRSRHHEYEDAHHRNWEPRRRSYDHANSVASSSRSHSHRHHKSSHSRHHGEGSTKARSVALTEENLKTLSETSSTKPSKAPVQYRTPYAETLPWGQSHMDLTIASPRNDQRTELVPRRRSESELQVARRTKEIDMNLAYGEIPPDLASRVDLDPARQNEDSAKTLVRKVEMLLDEAHCVQHSATSMIKHLQEKPESAAAVALTLSELSKVVAKISPAVLGMLKGGSPAVFSLLASPQFLIGTGVAVGITVVMFGGWKIVQQVKEQQAAREALAYHGVPMSRPAPLRTQSAYANSYDEALVVDDELSVIESWRRGIEPFGDDESADLELITPEADRATRADAREPRDDDFDVRSHRSTKTHRTSKTSKTNKTSKTSKTTKTNKTEKLHKSHKSKISDDEVPERKSSKSSSASVRGGPKSEIVRPSKGKGKEVKAIEASSSRARDDLELVMRPKVQRQQSDMFKSIFKHKKQKEDSSRSHRELVLA